MVEIFCWQLYEHIIVKTQNLVSTFHADHPNFLKMWVSHLGHELGFLCFVVGYVFHGMNSDIHTYLSQTKPKYIFFFCHGFLGYHGIQVLDFTLQFCTVTWAPPTGIKSPDHDGQHCRGPGQYSRHLWPNGSEPHCPILKKKILTSCSWVPA